MDDGHDRTLTARLVSLTPRRTGASAPDTELGDAIAAHSFERRPRGRPVPRVVNATPRRFATPSRRPAWHAFEGILEPRSGRYLSFRDRDHLLRYVLARGELAV